jgi:hypothetical protein
MGLDTFRQKYGTKNVAQNKTGGSSLESFRSKYHSDAYKKSLEIQKKKKAQWEMEDFLAPPKKVDPPVSKPVDQIQHEEKKSVFKSARDTFTSQLLGMGELLGTGLKTKSEKVIRDAQESINSDDFKDKNAALRFQDKSNLFVAEKTLKAEQAIENFFGGRRKVVEEYGEIDKQYLNFRKEDGSIDLKSFLSPSKVLHLGAQTAGSLVPAIGIGMATRDPKALQATMGFIEKGDAVQSFSEKISQEKGIPVDQLSKEDLDKIDEMSDYYGLVSGMLESIAPEHFIQQIGGKKVLEGSLKNWLYSTPVETLRGVFTEGGTEGLQRFLQNLIAKESGISPDQDLMEGVIEEAAAGALGGGIMGVAGGYQQNKAVMQPAQPQKDDNQWTDENGVPKNNTDEVKKNAPIEKPTDNTIPQKTEPKEKSVNFLNALATDDKNKIRELEGNLKIDELEDILDKLDESYKIADDDAKEIIGEDFMYVSGLLNERQNRVKSTAGEVISKKTTEGLESDVESLNVSEVEEVNEVLEKAKELIKEELPKVTNTAVVTVEKTKSKIEELKTQKKELLAKKSEVKHSAPEKAKEIQAVIDEVDTKIYENKDSLKPSLFDVPSKKEKITQLSDKYDWDDLSEMSSKEIDDIYEKEIVAQKTTTDKKSSALSEQEIRDLNKLEKEKEARDREIAKIESDPVRVGAGKELAKRLKEDSIKKAKELQASGKLNKFDNGVIRDELARAEKGKENELDYYVKKAEERIESENRDYEEQKKKEKIEFERLARIELEKRSREDILKEINKLKSENEKRIKKDADYYENTRNKRSSSLAASNNRNIEGNSKRIEFLENVLKTSKPNLIQKSVSKEVKADIITTKEAERKDPKNLPKNEDVGEKIGGAKKDLYTRQKEAFLEKVEDSEFYSLPVSKLIPELDYQNLVDNGVDLNILKVFNILRHYVGTKPRQRYYLNAWIEKVKQVREFGSGLLQNSKLGEGKAKELMSKELFKANSFLYDKLDFIKNKDIRSFVVVEIMEVQINGAPTNYYTIMKNGKRVTNISADNLESMSDKLREYIDKNKAGSERGSFENFKKNVNVYTFRVSKKIKIMYRQGKKEYTFAEYLTLDEARKALRNEENMRKWKDEFDMATGFTENTFRDTKDYSVGERKYRDGDISADEFRKQFGFRGVEFGNWLTAEDRRIRLNMAYDSFKDLSKIIKVPDNSLSLNGELGFAFGSRGSGGKDPNSAHYEPGKVAINLTKRSGAGAVAHEWWHAFDNYLARKSGKKYGYITGIEQYERKELNDAVKELMKYIRSSDLYQRSAEADKLKGKDYYKNPTELGARAFEVYISEKLRRNGQENTFLVQLLRPEDIEVTLEGSYPYAKGEEIEKIFNLMENIFNVLKVNEDKTSSILYDKKIQTAGGKVYNSNKKSGLQGSPLKIKFKKNGSFTFANQKIESPADVAFAFRQLKNEAVENLIAIGLKGDKPITVEIISIGTLNASLVHPREVTALLKAKGADGVYYMHNHPSGEIDPSDNDYLTTTRLSEVHKNIGIAYKGHIIIDTNKFGFIDENLNYTAMNHLEAGKNPTKVSAYKKYLEWVEDAEFGPAIKGPTDSYEIYKGIRLDDKNVMALFLDPRNRVLTSQIFPINESTAEKIFEHSLKYPTAALIVGGNNLGNSLSNINRKMTQNGIELLDIINIDKKNGSYLTLRDAMRDASFSDFNEVREPSQKYGDDLIQEARKYNSADEFVKAQGEPVYHGSDVEIKEFSKKFGGETTGNNKLASFHFTSDKTLAKDYGTQAILKKNENISLNTPEGMEFEKFARNSSKITEGYVKLKKPLVIDLKGKSINVDKSLIEQERAIKKGYDGIIYKNATDNVLFNPEAKPSDITVVFKPENIKTKSQLTEIWNKANKNQKMLSISEETKIATIRSENELLGELKQHLDIFHEMGIEDSGEVYDLIEKLENYGLTAEERMSGFELLERAKTKVRLIREKQEAIKRLQENRVKKAREKAIEIEKLGKELKESFDLGLLDVDMDFESISDENIDVILSQEMLQKEINKFLKKANPFLAKRLVINIAKVIKEIQGNVELHSAGSFNDETGNIIISQMQSLLESKTTIPHEILHNAWMYLTDEERAEVAKYYRGKTLEEKRELMGYTSEGKSYYDLYVKNYKGDEARLIQEMGITEAAFRITTNPVLIHFKKIVELFIRLINKVSSNKIFRNEVDKLNALSVFKNAFNDNNFFEGRDYRYPEEGYSIPLKSIQKESSTIKISKIVEKRNELLKKKREMEKAYLASEEGARLIEKNILETQAYLDANKSVIQGIKNNPYFKKEKTIKDDMGSGYLMEKGGKFMVVESKNVNKYIGLGYSKGIEIDSLASAYGFENGEDYLNDQLTRVIPVKVETAVKKLLSYTDKLYGEIGAELARTNEIIQKSKDDKNSFYLGMRVGGEVMKNKYKGKLNKFKNRRDKVRAAQDFFGLSDGQFKKIGGKRNIQFMTDWEFKQFMDKLRISAEQEVIRSQAREMVVAQIEHKQLKKTDNLRIAMELPPINEMTYEQLREFDRALEPTQFGDQFFTQRQLETVKNTELAGIKTIREAREILARKLGVEKIDIGSVVVSPTMDKARYDSSLANQNPFYKMMVDETNVAMLEADARFLTIEKDINELIKRARKSRPRILSDKIVPEDTIIFDYLESANKTELAKKMTDQELASAEYIRRKFEEMRDYLISNKTLKNARENYITHIRRDFFENWKSDGFAKAFKEIFEQNKEDQANFEILSGETGEILPLEKFFQFSLRRSGELKPSQNVAKAFLTYTKAFERKRALDSLIPKLDIFVYSISPTQTTEKGLVMDRSLKKFVNAWINNKKGRRYDFGGFLRQGGKADVSLLGLKFFTSILDLGFSIPGGIASNFGEQASNYTMQGTKKYAIGIARGLTGKGRRITNKYRNFTGKNPWIELSEVSQHVGNKFFDGLFILFRDAQVRANKQYLLGSLTEQEWRTETISPERLADMKRDMGRWRVVDGAKSIVGNTSAGGIITQYKTWAIPILTSVSNDATYLLKTRNFNSKEGSELFRSIVVMGGIGLLIKAILDDDDDDSFMGQLIKRSTRDLLSTFGALDPTLIANEPRVVAFLTNIATGLKQLVWISEYNDSKVIGERYKTTGDGYKEGDLKGINTIKRALKPSAVRQFKAKEEEEDPASVYNKEYKKMVKEAEREALKGTGFNSYAEILKEAGIE